MKKSIEFVAKEESAVHLENVALCMLRVRTKQASAPYANQNADTLHTHSHAELFACLEGSVHLQTASGILVLQPGDIAIVPSGFLHCKLPSIGRTKACVLDFTCSLRKRTGAADLMKEMRTLLHPGALTVARDQLRLCEELWEISQSEQTGYSYLPALQLVSVLAKMYRSPLERIGQNESPTTTLPSADPAKNIDRLDRLSYLLTVYFMTDLTVGRAAELLFISPRHLERIMQKEYGRSFHQVLCDQRLSAAEQMLQDPTLSISHVAATVGFPSRAAFCRIFEKRHGITPAAFQKRYARSEERT